MRKDIAVNIKGGVFGKDSKGFKVTWVQSDALFTFFYGYAISSWEDARLSKLYPADRKQFPDMFLIVTNLGDVKIRIDTTCGRSKEVAKRMHAWELHNSTLNDDCVMHLGTNHFRRQAMVMSVALANNADKRWNKSTLANAFHEGLQEEVNKARHRVMVKRDTINKKTTAK